MPRVPATQLTLKLLRKQGWTVDVVERWVGKPGGFGVHKDLFGCIDVLAVDHGRLLAVQSTSDTSGRGLPDHVRKCLAEPRLALWLTVGCFEVWGWAKRGGRGQRKTYQLRRQPVGLDGGFHGRPANPEPLGEDWFPGSYLAPVLLPQPARVLPC
jgi:hypothetical protein